MAWRKFNDYAIRGFRFSQGLSQLGICHSGGGRNPDSIKQALCLGPGLRWGDGSVLEEL